MAEHYSGGTSELYEYDAPSQVVDLKELQNADNDDKWFGKSPFKMLIWLLVLSWR